MYVQYVFKEQRYLHASSSPTFRSSIFQALSLVQEQKAQQQRFLSVYVAKTSQHLVFTLHFENSDLRLARFSKDLY